MARHVEGPWFRDSKSTWYCTLNGKMVSLKVRGRENRAEAVSAWHRLMAETAPTPPQTPTITAPITAPPAGPTVSTLLTAFLNTKRGVVRTGTVVVYSALIKHVVGRWGDFPAAGLKVWEVSKWLANLPLGANTKYDIGGLLRSAFRWATEEGLLAIDPLKGLKRPSRKSRGAGAVISSEDRVRLLEAAPPALRLLLTLLNETGARPSELSRLEAAHLDLASRTATLPEHKTEEKTGEPRLLVLTPAAVELLRTQAALHPTGPLLLNGKSKPWKKDAIVLALSRLRQKTGIRAISYGFRHSFASDALAAGAPEAHVAALMGHRTTQMLSKHYGHLTSRVKALRQTLDRVRGKEKTPDQAAEGGEEGQGSQAQV